MSSAESRRAVRIVPEGWTPKAGPDPVGRDKHGLIGAQVSRLFIDRHRFGHGLHSRAGQA